MPSATTTTPQTQSTLTLPRAHFATLAPASYLTTQLTSQPPTRPSGRTPTQFRSPTCNISSLTHATGSAVVRNGGTAVVVGVTAETILASEVATTAAAAAQLPEQEQIAQLALLIPHVELSTGCAPAFAPAGGGPPGVEAQGLSVQLLRLLLASRLIGLDDLTIQRGDTGAAASNRDDDEDENMDVKEALEGQAPEDTVAYWTLYINAVVLSLDGAVSLIDTLWAATFAAFRDVRLPRAWWDADQGVVLCSDILGEARALALHERPIAATWGVFRVPRGIVSAVPHGESDAAALEAVKSSVGQVFVLADPDGFEDGLCKESVTLLLARKGKSTRLFSVVKSGGTSVGLEDISGLVKVAEKRWKEWDAILP